MKKILYFEDEKWYADHLVYEIENQTQFQVTLVTTPSDFFKEIKNDNQYDLFILDIMAPMILFKEDDLNNLNDAQQRRLNDGLNVGTVFYEIIRSMNEYKETPVIFYTSKSKPQMQDNRVKYFSKPIDPNPIINAINELLKH